MTLLLRVVFMGLALLALVAQMARIDADAADLQAPGLDERLAALGLQAEPSSLSDVLAADAPGCAEPVMVTRMRFDGLGRAASRSLLSGASTPRFVYLGGVADHLDPASVAARWAAAGALRAVGLRTAAVPREIVLVGIPAACPGLRDFEWSQLSPWG